MDRIRGAGNRRRILRLRTPSFHGSSLQGNTTKAQPLLPQFHFRGNFTIGSFFSLCIYLFFSPTKKEECTADSRPEYLSLNLWLFVGSQLLTGAGAAPLYTLGVTYLDENVTKKMSSVYLGKSENLFQNRHDKFLFPSLVPISGIYYTLSLVGPALGYLLGGELLKIYTDFLTNDPNE